MWKDVLRDFWEPFEELVKQTSQIPISEVIDKLDILIGRHFFPVRASVLHPQKSLFFGNVFGY